MKKLSSPSIILEWETVQEVELSRVLTGLREICKQITELAPRFDRPAELIICYEPAVAREQDPRAIAAQAAPNGEWPCPVVFLEIPSGTAYYEKKNSAAQAASNDIVVFFDSDLIPDAGWLEAMLTPFQQWHVGLIVGATHLDHARLYDMAVALFWIFKPATPRSIVRPTISLRSNNFAVRRALFLRFLFPNRPSYRGQCTELGFQLMRAGITMYEQTGGRASHPPPPREKFILRAWHAGNDEHFYHSLEGKTSLATDWAQIQFDYRAITKRIKERSCVLEPSGAATVLAWVLGVIYYFIKATGYLAACLQSRLYKSAVPAQA